MPQAQQQLNGPRQQRQPHRQRHPFGRARFGHARERRTNQHTGERSWADRQAVGAAKQHGQQSGDQAGVKPGDQGHTGQARVSHGLRDHDQRHRQTCQHLGAGQRAC